MAIDGLPQSLNIVIAGIADDVDIPEDFGKTGINPVIHGVITLKGVLLPAVILAATCFVASFYPALRAARMQPAVGMRET